MDVSKLRIYVCCGLSPDFGLDVHEIMQILVCSSMSCELLCVGLFTCFCFLVHHHLNVHSPSMCSSQVTSTICMLCTVSATFSLLWLVKPHWHRLPLLTRSSQRCINQFRLVEIIIYEEIMCMGTCSPAMTHFAWCVGDGQKPKVSAASSCVSFMCRWILLKPQHEAEFVNMLCIFSLHNKRTFIIL